MTARRRLALAAAAVPLLVAGLVPLPAHAEPGAQDLVVEASLAADGALAVQESLTFAGAAPAQVVQKIATTRPAADRSERLYTVTDVAARTEAGPLPATTKTEGDYLVVTVPTQGSATVTLSYRVAGAVHPKGDSTQFQYRLVQGLSVPVEKVRATVSIPGSFEDFECKSGPPAATRVCNAFQGGTHASPLPTVNDGPLGVGEVVDVSLTFVPGAVAANENVKHRWSLDRAFGLGAGPLLSALLAALAGLAALWALHRRAGEDAAFAHPVPIASFEPVDEHTHEFRLTGDVRPGQVGTLLDERVDTVDVAATLLDLAVRGHVCIHEMPRTNPHDPLDWRLERTEGTDAVQPWETTLLDAAATDGGLLVSEIGPAVAAVVGTVQDELYTDMVARGWYSARPDETRARWNLIGWIGVGAALVLTAVLVAFTTFGWLGIVAIALSLALLLVAREMPARTSHGASVLAGLLALRQDLQSEPTDRMPAGRELEELSEVLPYAVVLGGQDRWVNAVAAADDDATPDGDDLGWYRAEGDWRLAHLPASIDAFVTTVTGRLNRRH